MTSPATIQYQTDDGVRFRIRVRPNPDGPGWELIKERKIGTDWHRTTRDRVSDVYIDTTDPVLL